MADSIDRKELLNNRPEYLNPQMEDEIKSARHQGWNDCNSYYYDLIIKQPKVDTERHAHWIYDEYGETCSCSNCDEVFSVNPYEKNRSNYCPTCGAKMDEKTE
jgi:formamidopyrimidine-DNA glycosylase